VKIRPESRERGHAVDRTIRRRTRKQYSAEEKIQVGGVPAQRGEHCRAGPREGIAESLYYSWSKEFLEVGKKRLALGEM
jgi:transposase